MKQSVLDENAQKCDIILSTFNMAAEALDIPKLNTLFLSTPKSNIEQSCGRILRQEHSVIPLIIDICDNFMPFDRQTKNGLHFIKKINIILKNLKYKIMKKIIMINIHLY